MLSASESRAPCVRTGQTVGKFNSTHGVFHPTLGISNPTRGVSNPKRGVPNPIHAFHGIVHGGISVEFGRWRPAFGVSPSVRQPKRRKRRAKALFRASADLVFAGNLASHGVQNTKRGFSNTKHGVLYPTRGVLNPMESSFCAQRWMTGLDAPTSGRRGLGRRPRVRHHLSELRRC